LRCRRWRLGLASAGMGCRGGGRRCVRSWRRGAYAEGELAVLGILAEGAGLGDFFGGELLEGRLIWVVATAREQSRVLTFGSMNDSIEG